MSAYRLTHQELLEYPGLNGMVGACHLRVYERRRRRPLCVVGSFDVPVGTTITNGIELVATAISERIGTGRFKLIQWLPHTETPFVEMRLQRVRAFHPVIRMAAVNDDGSEDVEQARRVTVRFASPEWRACSEQRIAKLLGADALSELASVAGEPGEYDAARVLGSSQQARSDALRRYNRERAEDVVAQLAEWGIR